MIHEVPGLIYGPYTSGQEHRFKMDVIKAREKQDPRLTHFCIETPETEPGFPDVLAVHGGAYTLFEFKVSDRQGYITFEHSQPLFYRRNRGVRIFILAWDVSQHRLIQMDAEDAVKHVFETASHRFLCPKGPLPLPLRVDDMTPVTEEELAVIGVKGYKTMSAAAAGVRQ
jgi:hypothetical protein